MIAMPPLKPAALLGGRASLPARFSWVLSHAGVLLVFGILEVLAWLEAPAIVEGRGRTSRKAQPHPIDRLVAVSSTTLAADQAEPGVINIRLVVLGLSEGAAYSVHVLVRDQALQNVVIDELHNVAATKDKLAYSVDVKLPALVSTQYLFEVLVRDTYPGLSSEESLVSFKRWPYIIQDSGALQPTKRVSELGKPDPHKDTAKHTEVAHSDTTEMQSMAAKIISTLACANDWQGKSADELRVEEVSSSGDRAFRTFKITAGTSVACLKVLSPVWMDKDLGHHHHTNMILRIVAVSGALSFRGLTPRLLAYNIDDAADVEALVVSEWQDGKTLASFGEESETSILLVIARDMGATLARIHSVGTVWFEEFRAHLLSELPLSDLPAASHAWCYFVRGGQWMSLVLEHWSEDPEVAVAFFRVWAESGNWSPRHAVAKRVVTSHGDFNARNLLRGIDGRFRVVDLDCACVMQAIFDLALGFNVCLQLGKGKSTHTLECKRAFLAGYLQQLDDPIRQEDIEALGVDAELAQLVFWTWDVHNLSEEEVLDRVYLCQALAAKVRASKKLQLEVLAEGFSSWTSKFINQHSQDRVDGPWYYAVRRASWGARVFMIKALNNRRMALAMVEHDLQLVQADLSDDRQLFFWQGQDLLHLSSVLVARATAMLTSNYAQDDHTIGWDASVDGFFKLGAPRIAPPVDTCGPTHTYHGADSCLGETEGLSPHFSNDVRRQGLAKWRFERRKSER